MVNNQRNQALKFPWGFKCLVALFLLFYTICASVPSEELCFCFRRLKCSMLMIHFPVKILGHLQKHVIEGLFTWRWGTPGRWGNMWRVTPPLCKRDHTKMIDYMDRRVTPPKRVTSPIWGTPPLYKQALKCSADYTMINDDRLGSVIWDHSDHGRSNEPMGIHSGQGFIASFDPQWSKWSRITDPDPDHPKETNP